MAVEFRAPRTPLVPIGGVDLHQHDMSVTFGSDVTLAAAQEQLSTLGQWLPIDGDPTSTIGDLINFNSTGPLRLGYGAWRDLLLGVQFTNGRRELISAGGQTVKNVAGYDLTKFIVGSAGVFGSLVTATTRTYRKPQAALLARFPADAHRIGQLIPTSHRPQWAMLTADALLCGYLGDERTINYHRANLPNLQPLEICDRGIDDDMKDRAARWQAHGTRRFRASVPPTKILEFASHLAAGSWIADAAFGIVLGSDIQESQIPYAEQAAKTVGGSVRFFSGAGEKSTIEFSTNPVERKIIDRLKQAFDPDGNLSPLPRSSR